jgi:hypothetical protein
LYNIPNQPAAAADNQVKPRVWQVDRCDGVQVEVRQLLQQPATCCVNDVNWMQRNSTKVLRDVPAECQQQQQQQQHSARHAIVG